MIKSKNKKGVRWLHNGIDFTIKKSDRPDKKLVALYTEGNRVKKIYFGQTGFEHYFDKTGLLDPKLNHEDKERRRLFRARFNHQYDGKPNPLTMSWNLLW